MKTLKIKDEWINKYISCKGMEYFLSEKLTQDEIKHIQLCVSKHLVEESLDKKVEKEFIPKSYNKTCKGSKELGTNCGKCKKCLLEE